MSELTALNIQKEILSGDYQQSGYGKKLSLFPAANDDWRVSFGKAGRMVEDIKSESLRAAQKLAQKFSDHPGPLRLFFSGGIDSEFMLNCFIEAQVDFEVYSCRFKNSLNQHDMAFVEKFKIRNPRLSYREFILDVEDFFKSAKALELAKESLCTLPHLLPLMLFCEQTPGPLVFATGEPFLLPVQNTWCLRERESIASFDRFFKKNGILGTPYFFQSTPEIFVSYLKDPIMKDLVQFKRPGKQHSLTSRIDIYSRYFKIEPRTKYHGYENIEPEISSMQSSLEKLFPQHSRELLWPYEELIKKLDWKVA